MTDVPKGVVEVVDLDGPLAVIETLNYRIALLEGQLSSLKSDGISKDNEIRELKVLVQDYQLMIQLFRGRFGLSALYR